MVEDSVAGQVRGGGVTEGSTPSDSSGFCETVRARLTDLLADELADAWSRAVGAGADPDVLARAVDSRRREVRSSGAGDPGDFPSPHV